MLLRLFYSLVLFLVSPLLLATLYKPKKGKPTFGSRWKEHFGFVDPTGHDNPIWFHAVSVGEVIAATPIIKSMHASYPEQTIIITTTTATGAQQAEKLPGKILHRYMPIDFAWCVRRFIKTIQPKALFIMETELWPNTLHQAQRANIPITLINARLSERSCRRYLKVPPLCHLLMHPLDQILCQYTQDAERFIRLGVSKHKVTVTGSVKFDIHIDESIPIKAKQLRAELGANRPTWIAASTHSGEDELLYQAHKQILLTHPEALLIIVPRHPERFDEVYELGRSMALSVGRRTVLADNKQHQVYLGDTMGELLLLLASADVCFMGGSLIGDKVGGHNLLEPAALSLPIISGPSYFNFAQIADKLLANDALFIAQEPQAISHQVLEFLNNKSRADHAGRQAKTIVEDNRGAVSKTLSAVSQYFDQQGATG
ncbi:lipid IV(A) 3-deoxy-D-manno-octulosonic acid transferase [Vibrio ulleungensis]|uniref:3-deoxy-D-manno-octulosonic acid transferase n=1 Tax=Vibrio ulleungensis TaxID=2807619 RepID=A0ABS2HJJ2_9VIBR|nr:lipid IV(A) 3-deoxy-D-manno-octulosonic acid transferase [Vibrio ulleungensis]MBM7037675.1 lipid IV(A) 3-deoxy-D-manno-octulosonic acid transferase [Vibrio ulleungensis]